MDYVVKLRNFEGPLDLLLELIHQKEMDIFDIQISEITSDYMQSITLMREHNIEITSNFTKMASMLLSIKTKMMLPTEKEDARDELIKQLLEYREYKQAAERLQEMKEIEEKYFKRQKQDKVKKQKRGTISDISKIYKQVLELKKTVQSRTSKLDDMNRETLRFRFSIEEQIEFLKQLLVKGKVDVYKMFMDMEGKEEIIETFGAILELSKTQYILILHESNALFIERRVHT
ncbi:hypothetical protein CN918_32670 [Priestia megaterium]|nr:hypothetical protein CN918_32670 [Priestia megaterium]